MVTSLGRRCSSSTPAVDDPVVTDGAGGGGTAGSGVSSTTTGGVPVTEALSGPVFGWLPEVVSPPIEGLVVESVAGHRLWSGESAELYLDDVEAYFASQLEQVGLVESFTRRWEGAGPGEGVRVSVLRFGTVAGAARVRAGPPSEGTERIPELNGAFLTTVAHGEDPLSGHRSSLRFRHRRDLVTVQVDAKTAEGARTLALELGRSEFELVGEMWGDQPEPPVLDLATVATTQEVVAVTSDEILRWSPAGGVVSRELFAGDIYAPRWVVVTPDGIVIARPDDKVELHRWDHPEPVDLGQISIAVELNQHAVDGLVLGGSPDESGRVPDGPRRVVTEVPSGRRSVMAWNGAKTGLLGVLALEWSDGQTLAWNGEDWEFFSSGSPFASFSDAAIMEVCIEEACSYDVVNSAGQTTGTISGPLFGLVHEEQQALSPRGHYLAQILKDPLTLAVFAIDGEGGPYELALDSVEARLAWIEADQDLLAVWTDHSLTIINLAAGTAAEVPLETSGRPVALGAVD